MSNTPCHRCERADRYIPTDQFAKFDGEVHYLCGDIRGDGCYGTFRKIVVEADKRHLDTRSIPPHQFVKTSDGQLHFLGDDDWQKFRQWYHHGSRSKQRTSEMM